MQKRPCSKEDPASDSSALFTRKRWKRIRYRQVFWLTAFLNRLPIPENSGIMVTKNARVVLADHSYGNSSGLVPDSLLMFLTVGQ